MAPRGLLVVVVVLLATAGTSSAKGVSTTVCGSDRCRTTTSAIDVATLPGAVAAPRAGRYYTVALRVETRDGPTGWTVVYEANREIIRAGDAPARAFLGGRWARLTRNLRAEYAAAIRGLAPMRVAPK